MRRTPDSTSVSDWQRRMGAWERQIACIERGQGEGCEAQKADKSISDDASRSARTCKQRPLKTKLRRAKGEPGRKEWTAGWLRGGCTGTRTGRMRRMGEGERARGGHRGVIGTSRGGSVRFLLFCSQETRHGRLPLDAPSPRQSASPGDHPATFSHYAPTSIRLFPYPHSFSCSIDNLNGHEIMVYSYVPYSCSADACNFCALRWYYTAKPRANRKRSEDGGTDHLADGARCHLALAHTVHRGGEQNTCIIRDVH